MHKTGLDIGLRQMIMDFRQKVLIVLGEDWSNPVSYTHLDVYKRQSKSDLY